VNAEIKTNTRLRISLMVEDKQDSMDVIGIPDAASVNHKGRGYFRVGQGEVVPIQTALSTAPAGRGGGPAVEVRDFTIDAAPVEPAPKRPGDGPTDLNVLVASIKEAFSNSGATPPRRPWPDPLPDRLSLDDLAQFPPATGRPEGELHFALADDPEGQTRYPVGWPLRRGNLLLYGVVGSGTTTALSSIALEFARRSGPDRVHLYVFDFGAGELLSLAGLPHCAAAVGSADSERQMKVLRRLSDELRRRRALSVAERSAEPLLVFMIDNFEGFRSAYEATAWSAKYFDQFLRIYADGPEVGIVTALSASRVGGVPAAVSSSTSNKILFRLADLADFGSVGLSRRQLPTFVPGRAVTVDGQVLQVALPPVPLAEAAQIVQTAVAEAARIPRPVAELSADVLRADLAGQSAVGDSKWDLAVGVRDEDFAPAQLVMYDGEGGLVIGPARSGKSTTLLTVAASFRDAAPGAPVLGVACRRSPLQESPLLDRIVTDVDAIPDLIDQALLESGPVLVLMDDVDLLDDPSGRLAQLAASGRAGLRIVGAGRNDRLRGQYGHWTQKLRSSRVGVLLQPNLDFDGELLGVKLPSRVQVAMPPGRGFLAVEGDVELIQVAH
jgi:S-DNA-T family DNA segregation ATPase FtsK/SpoIIIE